MHPEDNMTEAEYVSWRLPDVYKGGSLFSTNLGSYIIAKDVTHEEYVQRLRLRRGSFVPLGCFSGEELN